MIASTKIELKSALSGIKYCAFPSAPSLSRITNPASAAAASIPPITNCIPTFSGNFFSTGILSVARLGIPALTGDKVA